MSVRYIGKAENGQLVFCFSTCSRLEAPFFQSFVRWPTPEDEAELEHYLADQASWQASFNPNCFMRPIPTLNLKPSEPKGEIMKEYLLQFFAYEHLPAHLQAVSQPFHEMAVKIVETLPKNPERTTALRKLLESKDCSVRALLFKE